MSSSVPPPIPAIAKPEFGSMNTSWCASGGSPSQKAARPPSERRLAADGRRHDARRGRRPSLQARKWLIRFDCGLPIG
jgi:hypothetical protein